MILVAIPKLQEWDVTDLKLKRLKQRLRELIDTRDLQYPHVWSVGRAAVDTLIDKLVTRIARLDP